MNGLYSQDKKLGFSVKAGGNYSIISRGYGEDLGVYGGAFIEYNIKDRFYLQTEILFSTTDDIYFFEFPLLVKYTFSETIFGFAGPKLTYLLNDAEKYTESINDPYDLYEFKKMGIAVEIGIQHNLYPNLFIEGRFGYNFTKQIDNTFYEDRFQSQVNTVKAGIGYIF